MIEKKKRKKQKSTPKNEGEQSNLAPFTYPGEDSKFKPGPPCLQDRNGRSPAHLHRSKKDKKEEKSKCKSLRVWYVARPLYTTTKHHQRPFPECHRQVRSLSRVQWVRDHSIPKQQAPKHSVCWGQTTSIINHAYICISNHLIPL